MSCIVEGKINIGSLLHLPQRNPFFGTFQTTKISKLLYSLSSFEIVLHLIKNWWFGLLKHV